MISCVVSPSQWLKKTWVKNYLTKGSSMKHELTKLATTWIWGKPPLLPYSIFCV